MFGLFEPRWTRAETLFALLLLATVATLGLSDVAREWLRFDRELIAAGEAWRIVSGHFVHLTPGHLALDGLGLALLLLFFRDVFSPGDWAFALLSGALLVGAGLWYFSPELAGYVGISGLLHTLLFAGLLLSFRHSPWINGIVFVAMSARIWQEQQPGYDIHQMMSVIGGAVAVDAHLYGALASLPVTLLLWRRSQARQARFRAADKARRV